MSRVPLRAAGLFAVLLAVACATPREEGSLSPVAGDRVPPLVLPVTTGGTYHLAAATKEQTVVVVFYRGRF